MALRDKIQHLGESKILESGLLLLVGFLSVAILVYVAIFGFVTDSEFWAITLAQKFGHHGENISLLYKSLFYGLLKLVYFLPVDNWTHVILSRLEFAAIGSLILLMFWKIQKACFGPRIAFLMSAVLGCSYAFLTHLSRVRSDYLATFFYLCFCCYFISTIHLKSRMKWVWSSVFLLLSFLATPKAGLLIFSGFLGVLLSSPILNLRTKLRNAGLVFLGLFSLGHLFVYFFPRSEFLTSLQIAFSYFVDSSIASYAGYDFGSDFQHVIRFFKNNIIQSTLIIIALIHVIFGFKNRSMNRIENFLAVQFLSLIVLSLFYNQKYSFFIASIQPILLLAPGIYLWRMKYLDRRWARVSVLIALLVFQLVTLYRNYKYIRNDDQAAMITYLEGVYRRSNLKIYDVIGLLPRNNQYFAFLNESDSANLFSFEKIVRNPPDLIVNVAKMNLSSDIYEYRIRNYRDVGFGLYTRVFRWWDFGESCKVPVEKVVEKLNSIRLEDSQEIELLQEPIWPIPKVVGKVSMIRASEVNLCPPKQQVLSLGLIKTTFVKDTQALFSFDPLN